MSDRIEQLNQFTTGWVAYYSLASCKSQLTQLDEWIRRKLRCLRLNQCKRRWTIAHFLMDHGESASQAWLLASSGKGWWRLSRTPPVHRAMSIAWFQQQGLVSLVDRYLALQIKRNRRIR